MQFGFQGSWTANDTSPSSLTLNGTETAGASSGSARSKTRRAWFQSRLQSRHRIGPQRYALAEYAGEQPDRPAKTPGEHTIPDFDRAAANSGLERIRRANLLCFETFDIRLAEGR